LDVIEGGSVPPKAIVEFENGMRLMVAVDCSGSPHWDNNSSHFHGA